MGLDWLRYGKARKSKGKEQQRKEMISNGTVTRGQVQKSNGKETTRLVRQGNRKARFRLGTE